MVIEHHPEDWIAFVIFWSLAFIVFLQFFTRYVLNDSLAWTEEIARYGLMWIVFIGGAMVTRRNTHIAVELLSNVMKPGPARAALLALVDFIKLGFLGLLAFFSLTITERMHQQRMTVFDLPMSYVYGGVAFGCFLMFVRQAINVWRNARDRLEPAGRHHASGLGGLKADDRCSSWLSSSSRSCSSACRCSSRLPARRCIYTHFIAGIPDFVDPASHGGRHRLVPAAGGAVLHPRRQPDELGRHHQPHL